MQNSSVSTLRQASTRLLGVLMMCALLLVGTLPMAGCNASTVAQDIVNWTPALQGAVATVDSSAALFLPADAPIFIAATAGFDAASDLLCAQAKAYLANPSAGVLAQLQAQIVVLQQQVNASLLQVVHITNPASQAHALTAIQGVGTIVSAILALVQSVSGKAALTQMASASTIKLAEVRPLMDEQRLRPIAEKYGTTVDGFYAYEARSGF